MRIYQNDLDLLKLTFHFVSNPRQWGLLDSSSVPEHLLPISTMITSVTPSRLPSFAYGVWERTACHLDEIHFHYPLDCELMLTDEPLDGVHFYGIFDDAYVRQDAFERMMVRCFHTLIVGARTSNHPVQMDPFWPEFLTLVEKIERRLEEESKKVA